jgi:hypothetical protein
VPEARIGGFNRAITDASREAPKILPEIFKYVFPEVQQIFFAEIPIKALLIYLLHDTWLKGTVLPCEGHTLVPHRESVTTRNLPPTSPPADPHVVVAAHNICPTCLVHVMSCVPAAAVVPIVLADDPFGNPLPK